MWATWHWEDSPAARDRPAEVFSFHGRRMAEVLDLSLPCQPARQTQAWKQVDLADRGSVVSSRRRRRTWPKPNAPFTNSRPLPRVVPQAGWFCHRSAFAQGRALFHDPFMPLEREQFLPVGRIPHFGGLVVAPRDNPCPSGENAAAAINSACPFIGLLIALAVMVIWLWPAEPYRFLSGQNPVAIQEQSDLRNFASLLFKNPHRPSAGPPNTYAPTLAGGTPALLSLLQLFANRY